MEGACVADIHSFEMRNGCLISLRTRPAPWLDTLAPGLSQLPACRRLQSGPALWMRLGPDEWWCWRDEESCDARLHMQVIAKAAGGFHDCVDLSDGHASCLLPAPAQDLLSTGCDLDIEQLATDFAGRTRLAAFTVVLARQPSQPGAMRLWVESSLAQSLQLWLARAAALQRA